MRTSLSLLLLCAGCDAALLSPIGARIRSIAAARTGSHRMDFGDSFYRGFDDWASEYPEEDRVNFPEYFVLPDGVFEVVLNKPLGIAFEEIDVGRGVKVDYLVEGGNAELSGVIKPGDILLATTAIKVLGAKWERRILPCRNLDFDTIMGAIGSNEAKWHRDRKNDVIMQFQRPSETKSEEDIKAYLERIEFPADSPWRL